MCFLRGGDRMSEDLSPLMLTNRQMSVCIEQHLVRRKENNLRSDNAQTCQNYSLTFNEWID
jgi:hypothetical protein